MFRSCEPSMSVREPFITNDVSQAKEWKFTIVKREDISDAPPDPTSLGTNKERIRTESNFETEKQNNLPLRQEQAKERIVDQCEKEVWSTRDVKAESSKTVIVAAGQQT